MIFAYGCLKEPYEPCRPCVGDRGRTLAPSRRHPSLLSPASPPTQVNPSPRPPPPFPPLPCLAAARARRRKPRDPPGWWWRGSKPWRRGCLSMKGRRGKPEDLARLQPRSGAESGLWWCGHKKWFLHTDVLRNRMRKWRSIYDPSTNYEKMKIDFWKRGHLLSVCNLLRYSCRKIIF